MFHMAVILAENGACDLWAVLAVRLDYLFQNTEDVLEKLDCLEVMPQLLKQRSRLCEW